MKQDILETVAIDLDDRSYPIHIGNRLLANEDLFRSFLSHSDQCLIVSNDLVAPLYLERLKRTLARFNPTTLTLPDGETEKSVQRWQEIHDQLTAIGATRDVTLIALGGGVIGDLVGFAAATYMRGVNFLQVPTTLLAQVDASVGGKTAINHAAGKNLIGAFHQPVGVIIDLATLATLPEREFRAGLAEVIKYGLIGDADFFTWLQVNRNAILKRNSSTLTEVIARCCRQKAKIVAADELETGQRALLNLGHTFGHAIEAEAGFGEVLHGEAVAIGCCAAANLSAELGMLDLEESTEIQHLIKSFGLPTRLRATAFEPDQLIQRMTFDKKNRAGKIRLILLNGIGEATIKLAPETETLREIWKRLAT